MLPPTHTHTIVRWWHFLAFPVTLYPGTLLQKPAPPDRTVVFNLFNEAALKNAKVAVESGLTILPFL